MISILDGLFWSFYYEYVINHNNYNRTKLLCSWLNNHKEYNRRIDNVVSSERSIETYLTFIDISKF